MIPCRHPHTHCTLDASKPTMERECSYILLEDVLIYRCCNVSDPCLGVSSMWGTDMLYDIPI